MPTWSFSEGTTKDILVIRLSSSHLCQIWIERLPAFIVACFGFYVFVQCFFHTFDVLCAGDFGTILMLK